jgi:hypothetical protein
MDLAEAAEIDSSWNAAGSTMLSKGSAWQKMDSNRTTM